MSAATRFRECTSIIFLPFQWNSYFNGIYLHTDHDLLLFSFPPRLFESLATMFNRSQSEYLICYHGPKLMVDRYGFNVELLVQKPLSMHGSSEVHTGYIYRRTVEAKKSTKCTTTTFDVLCDPLFANAWKICRSGLEEVCDHTAFEVAKHIAAKPRRVTRSVTKKVAELQ